MVDIHTHIIPEFDDGSRSLDESVAMAEKEFGMGTAVFLATPHVQSSRDIDNSPVIVERVACLNGEFLRRNIPLRVLPGAELFPCEAVLRGLEDGLPITLGGTGKYVLLDLPHSALPLNFDTILFEIQAKGVTPILAHPERCPTFQPTPDNVIAYVDRGIVFQLNAGSFVGRHGAGAKAAAEKIFAMRMAHFLASDAHGVRSFTLGSVAESLRTPESEDYVQLLVSGSGEAVLAGTSLPQLPAPPPVPKKRRWWSFGLART